MDCFRAFRVQIANCVSYLLLFVITSAFFVTPLLAQQQGLIYDNGAFINAPGQGPGGADASVSPISDGIWGVPAAEYYGARVADDFTIPAGQTWTISSARFFLYYFGTTNSLFTGMSLRIWDGSPESSNSQIIWGNTTANVMSDSAFTGTYFYAAAQPNTIDSIFSVDANVNITLSAGTYWLDWSTSLSNYDGGDPQQLLVPPDFQTETDALWMPSPPEWGGIGEQYPFQIYGTAVPEPTTLMLAVLSGVSLMLFRCRKSRPI